MFSRGKLFVIFAVILTAVLSGSAWAEFRPRVGVDSSGGEATLTVNGRPAVRFKTSNGNLTPEDRADITAQRLSGLIATGLDPRGLTVKPTRTTARVYAGEMLICVVTSADAKHSRTSALALANSWVSNMRTLLLMPAIKLSDTELLVPLGESRSVSISGAAVGPVYAKAADDSIAVLSANDSGRLLQVSGQKLGTTTVEVSIEGERASLTVTVKKYAGHVASLAYAQVTGSPCPKSIMCYAARQAAEQTVFAEPGASVRLGDVDCGGGALAQKGSRRVAVDVKIIGEGYIPFSGKAMVEIDNVFMPREQVQQLFYSNDPERLQKYQTLFAGKLELDKATRLLFHHQNGMGKRAHFVVELINPNNASATFRVFRGVSGPLVDTVLVGYIASTEFLKGYTDEVSVVETVPPMSRLILVSDMLSHNETTSGVMEMRQISGGPAYVRVVSNPPGLDEVVQGQIAKAPNPVVLSLSEQVYPSPVKTLSADYVIGQRWAFIPIGKHAVTDVTSQKKLYGNYGVTYNIDVKVTNPTDETKKVTVAFDPTAGLASGVFMIDGALVATKYARPPDDVPLVTYRLKPGEVRTLHITTLPVAGSNYPATLVVRS